MLFEQGCAQCVLWTQRPAPRAEIAAGMAAFLDSKAFGPLPARLQQAMG